MYLFLYEGIKYFECSESSGDIIMSTMKLKMSKQPDNCLCVSQCICGVIFVDRIISDALTLNGRRSIFNDAGHDERSSLKCRFSLFTLPRHSIYSRYIRLLSIIYAFLCQDYRSCPNVLCVRYFNLQAQIPPHK